jgi:hypothetical protein
LPLAFRVANTAATTSRSHPMLAIGVIALFILALVGLNLFEFGRID